MEEKEEYNLTRQTLENQHYRGFDCMNPNARSSYAADKYAFYDNDNTTQAACPAAEAVLIDIKAVMK